MGYITVAVPLVILLLTTAPTLEAKMKRNVLLASGWQYNQQPPSSSLPQPPILSAIHPAAAHQYFFPRTENYYHRMKPDAVVEIVMDPSEEIGNTMVEHSSMTTSIQSQAEYRASCIKEPGCRWECEPRADDLPPDCDCVCFYTDAKWDNIP
ncbi:unnamed protein product [Orchesella dallaii]|uniref:Uncharacterized protein n=1 Tax=Orchesella dallaii TaxID=48710 RepID=A0ABP1QRR3_9HEXA